MAPGGDQRRGLQRPELQAPVHGGGQAGRHPGPHRRGAVLVDPKTALYLKGTVVDYSDKLIGGGFKFANPNAKASCSCGESFNV